MSTVLYAWELGDDYGHVMPYLALAKALRERGHRPVLAAKDVSRIEAIADGFGDTLLQAPVWLPTVGGLPEPPLSYAEILHRYGYLHADGLLALVKSWRSIMQLVQPELLIADHAPTALLAARDLGIPCATFGTGFLLPPAVVPLPNMRPWLKVPLKRLEQGESLALAAVNQVLSRLRGGQLKNLAQLFSVAEHFLLTFPELDHYRQRADTAYWGPVIHRGTGVKPDWPDGPGKKIFAYLKPRYKRFDDIVNVLRALPHRTVLHAPGMSETARGKLENRNLQISREPIDMAEAEAQCDLAICHGGFSTVVGMLLSGRPLVILPMHLEQTLTGRNVAELGAGVMLTEKTANEDLTLGILRPLNESDMRAAAGKFARRHGGHDMDALLRRIALRCEEIIAARVGPAHAG